MVVMAVVTVTTALALWLNTHTYTHTHIHFNSITAALLAPMEVQHWHLHTLSIYSFLFAVFRWKETWCYAMLFVAIEKG